MSKTLLQILNILAFIATVIFNAWSNNGLVDGKTIGGVSDQQTNFFAPAGVTFAIWGIIYLGLAIFCVYQARDIFSSNKIDMDFFHEIGPWFIISSVANILWLVIWLYERPGWALLIMLVLFSSLLILYLRIGVGIRPVSAGDRFFVHLTFSIYLGWITVATIANATIFLKSMGWTGGMIAEPIWAAIMIIIAAGIGIAMILRRNDIAYSLVLVWAFTGIIIKRTSFPLDGDSVVIYAAGIGIALLVITNVVRLIQTGRLGYF